MSAPVKIKVLAVENDPNDYMIIVRELKAVATVDVALNRDAFLKMLDEDFDVALVDLNLNNLRGTEAIAILKERHPHLPVIIVTGSVSAREADDACAGGAERFFMKQVEGVPGLSRAVVQVHEARLKVMEAERLSQKAIRDQRLEQLGDLSTGIVHDFNGILAVGMMGAEQLRTRINPMDERVLDTMLSAFNRGAEMTAQVLAFARGTNGSVFKNIAPEYLLGQVGQLVRTTFPPSIRIEIATVLGTSHVKGDATQLIQVLTNLATNARDAMPRGGTLSLKAQNMARMPGGTSPCVVITVSDTGTGIPKESLELVWEPFYTTKAPGKGTGLGLPTVKRIVDAHHGVVKVLSGPEGTSFHIHLPVAVPWTSPEAALTEASLDGAGRTVLLVDDQQSFLDLAAMLLEEANYRVLKASNGPEALSQFRVGQEISVVISDVSMPVMSGQELARNLRSVGLRLPIIFLTGCDGSLSHDPEPDAVLQKPVSREKLLATLARVLTPKGAGSTLPT